jgi:hypothetical protein
MYDVNAEIIVCPHLCSEGLAWRPLLLIRILAWKSVDGNMVISQLLLAKYTD